MRTLKSLLVFSGCLYLAVAVFMYLFQESFIFHPAPVPSDFDYQFSSETEEVWVDNNDGRLHGVLFKAAKQADEIVLYFKGNMGNVGHSEGIATIFVGLGYDVLSMDYRGSGKSVGPLSEDRLLHDAELWHEWATERYGDKVRVVGYSLGTTFASHLAGIKKVAETILFAPMRSVEDIGQRRYPFIPTFLARYPLDSYSKLAKASGRILVFHGTDDQVIPIDSGESLTHVFSDDDKFDRIQGANHYTLLRKTEVIEKINAEWGAGR